MSTQDPFAGYHSFSMHHFVRALDAHADTYLATKHGVSYARFLCMVAIRSLATATQHNIAQWLQVDDAAVSRMLKSLIEAGFITVITDPSHGRKNLVNLTPKGDKLVRTAAKELETQYQELASYCGVDSVQINQSVLHMHQILQQSPQRKSD